MHNYQVLCLMCFYGLHIHVNNLFLASLELGLSLAVSGENPTSSLVLFREPLVSCAVKEYCASSLNATRSAAAFSRHSTRRIHMLHAYGDGVSLSLTGIFSSEVILEAHLFLHPLALNKCTVVLLLTTSEHRRQTLQEVIFYHKFPLPTIHARQ